MTDYAREIAVLLEQQLGIAVPSTDTDLLGTGLLDSLSFVELLAGLEQRFGVQVDLATLEIDDLRTLEKIGAFVAGRSA
jgi:acyl carrier protein